MPKKTQRLPHLFNEVLDAVALLKESKGSSEKSILNKVDTILHLRQKHLKKSIGTIHRALRYGLKSGLLRLINGKYRLGMSNFDYNVYRRVARLRSTDQLYKQFKSRRGRRNRSGKNDKKGRGRGRKEPESDTESTESKKTSPSKSESDSVIQVRRGGRKRRGRSRRRRSRRGRRRLGQVTAKTLKKRPTPAQRKVPEIVSQKDSNDTIKSITLGQDSSQKNSNESIKTTMTIYPDEQTLSHKGSNESIKTANYEQENAKSVEKKKMEMNDESQPGPSGRTHVTPSGLRCDNPRCFCNSTNQRRSHSDERHEHEK